MSESNLAVVDEDVFYVDTSVIPDKLYFKIGEVAKIIGVKAYVVRYWQSEFDEITPTKSRTNQRLFRRKDIETVLLVKKLLHDKGYTINGAKKILQDFLKIQKKPKSDQLDLSLEKETIIDEDAFLKSRQEISMKLREMVLELKESL